MNILSHRNNIMLSLACNKAAMQNLYRCCGSILSVCSKFYFSFFQTLYQTLSYQCINPSITLNYNLHMHSVTCHYFRYSTGKVNLTQLRNINYQCRCMLVTFASFQLLGKRECALESRSTGPLVSLRHIYYISSII